MKIKKFKSFLLCFVLITSFCYGEVFSWKSSVDRNIQIEHEERTIVKNQGKIFETNPTFQMIDESQPVFAQAKSTLPLVEGIPAFPKTAIEIGNEWKEKANIKIPFKYGDNYETFLIETEVNYTLEEPVYVDGRLYQRIIAYWYPFLIIPKKQSEETGLSRIAGYSSIDLLWDSSSGSPKQLTLNEEYQYRFNDQTFVYYNKITNQRIKTVIEIIREEVATEIQEKIQASKLENVEVKQAEQGVMLSIDDIHFEGDSSELIVSEKRKLDQIGSLLKALTKNKLMIVGHAANQAGSEEQELIDLSVHRAAAVANYLIESGIKTQDMIVSKGMGGSVPIDTNETPEGRAKNRRVEIVIIDLEIESDFFTVDE